ncbi:uncharacterized protein RAG0_16306 [Rhynchosporium agropyri]|uniref:Uncharacterized protein n=1 Tax=Rhynchosporium agropyri TaxID=914238 RepID=A0A1E1LRM1_9HELO|nr:uncharacterized protein RAG0_16306 [Rhynchosporium agropyri]
MLFSNQLLKFLALGTLAVAAPMVEHSGSETLSGSAMITERQESLGTRCMVRTKKPRYITAEDPNPHQNFVFKQITPSQQCKGSPGNSASVTKGLSVGWAFSIGAGVSANPAAGGPGASLDIGYSISRSVSTTTTLSFTCSTDSGKGKENPVCGFQRVQVTAYTQKEQICDSPPQGCPGKPTNCKDTGNTAVVFAPNAEQGGTETSTGNCYYDNYQLGLPCVFAGNELRSNPSSIPGGPQYVSCTDTRSAPGQ